MDFEKGDITENRRVLAVSRLKTFFRRLERNHMIPEKTAQMYIGDIITLDAMAKGEFDPSRVTNYTEN